MMIVPTTKSATVGFEFHSKLRPGIQFFLILSVILLFVAPIQADQLIVHNINYSAAKITGFDHGRLRFQTAEGRKREAWIDEIELLMLDRGSVFADFNRAERFFATSEPAKAVIRYQRSLLLSEDYWQALVSARMLMAMDRAGQLDKAVTTFIRIARKDESGAILATRLFPKVRPPKHRGRIVRAVNQLEGQLHLKLKPTGRALFTLLRFDLLQSASDDRAVSAAADVMKLAIPKAIRVESVYDIITRAIQVLAHDDQFNEAFKGLDQAILNSPKSILPELLWLKGRMLEKSAESQEALIRASWSYMRVVIHFPEHSLAPKSLYQTAELMSRIDKQDKAVALLRECLQHKQLDERTKQLAENELVQWQSP